ncbi:hypothetical protein BS50DRAFT_640052 [Corynespora cassiicola Philippines]|uniref:TLC domain-containing protein n=1 Tax=Corynespora cassiicola Philippines TaxID=1448308 RepID=A0A2T2N5D2_CORCC|nr:hypothetical protein BS50DRAFT_640052 [Corynespora cassiicola Philippines]
MNNSAMDWSTPHLGAPPIERLPDQLVSKLQHHGTLILATVTICFFFAREFVAGWLIPRYYPASISALDSYRYRNFVNHHVSAIAKFILICLGALTIHGILIGAPFGTPVVNGGSVSLGDISFMGLNIFVGMYLTELLYQKLLRSNPIIAVHHVGVVFMSAMAITINQNWEQEPNTSAYFGLLAFYAYFDMFAGFLTHPAVIIERTLPRNHKLNMRMFLVCCVIAVSRTLCETITVLRFFAMNWDKWTVSVKIVTPIFHCIFAAAQIRGSHRLWTIYKHHRMELKKVGNPDVENSTKNDKRRIYIISLNGKLPQDNDATERLLTKFKMFLITKTT